MGADAARKQRRKAAAKNMEKGSLHSAAKAGAAAMGGMVTGKLQSAAEAEAVAIGGMVTRGLIAGQRRREWSSSNGDNGE
jgi:hypothetical protein